MWIRGTTSLDFEYLYAVAREPAEPNDEAGFYDRVRGGYVGDKWAREWVYKNKTKTKTRYVKRKGRKKKKKIKTNVKFRKNLYFFDEFGPYVHEVREFDVKFDPSPVAHSRLMLTNEWDAVCAEYRANPFGAYFILASTSRNNAIISGADELTFAESGAVVDHQLRVYGRTVVISDQEEIEVRNEDRVRARGEIVAEVDSDWIQSEEAAQSVADWIADHWSTGADELTVEIFGNTLFEVGDVVSIAYSEKMMSPSTHRYFVTKIDTSFEGGLDTTLTLRRRN